MADVRWEEFRQALDAAMQRTGDRSLEAFARRAGVSHPTLSNIRNRQKRPSPQTLAKLAPLLGVPLDTLLVWAGHRRATAPRDELLVKWQILDLPPDVSADELLMLKHLFRGIRNYVAETQRDESANGDFEGLRERS